MRQNCTFSLWLNSKLDFSGFPDWETRTVKHHGNLNGREQDLLNCVILRRRQWSKLIDL